jgi:hypothetical protein
MKDGSEEHPNHIFIRSSEDIYIDNIEAASSVGAEKLYLKLH